MAASDNLVECLVAMPRASISRLNLSCNKKHAVSKFALSSWGNNLGFIPIVLKVSNLYLQGQWV
jgi:hypothetical protein